jgi:pyruvate/2-oxoglutarate dehydrogenase complex dihydrolipoamide acyltransferase (E2) component
MSIEIRIPQIGFAMQEGNLSEWLAADGARIENGAPLYMLEIDKAVQEVPSPAAGTLKIHAPAGQTYPVGELIAEIL